MESLSRWSDTEKESIASGSRRVETMGFRHFVKNECVFSGSAEW